MGADRVASLRLLILAAACGAGGWVGSRYVAQSRYENTSAICDDTLVGGPGLLIYDRLLAETFCAPFPVKVSGKDTLNPKVPL